MPLTIDQHLFKHIGAILYFFFPIQYVHHRTEDLQTVIVRPQKVKRTSKDSYFFISLLLPRFVTCSLLFSRIRKQTEKSKRNKQKKQRRRQEQETFFFSLNIVALNRDQAISNCPHFYLLSPQSATCPHHWRSVSTVTQLKSKDLG